MSPRRRFTSDAGFDQRSSSGTTGLTRFPSADVTTSEDVYADRIRQLIHRWYDEVWTQRREAAIDEMMAPECLVLIEGSADALDRDAFRMYHRNFLDAVPDVTLGMTIVAVEGATAVTSWRATGTHTGSGLGIPPSNGRVDFTGVTMFRFANDRIVVSADSWNRNDVIASTMPVGSRERRAATRLDD